MGRYWNYVDALAYSLAVHSPDKSDKFTADPATWHQAVYEIREAYGDRLPNAFRHVFFEMKPGQPPYSPQVEHFLHVLAQARLMSAPNPAFVVLEMSDKQKAALIRLNEERLREHKELLATIGQELHQRVTWRG